MSEERTVIGEIVNVHGLRGNVKVYPYTDDMKRFQKLRRVFIDDVAYEVDGCSLQKTTVLLHLKSINTVEEAEKLRGKVLTIPKEERMPLPKDRFYIEDLLGLPVYDQERKEIGSVEEVGQGPANDVLYVKGEQMRYAIPMVKEFMTCINLEGRRIDVVLLEGMDL